MTMQADHLSPADNPDGQPPLPFAAAVHYARSAMAWARAPLPANVVAISGQSYGSHPLQGFDVYAPPDARAAPVLVFWHGGGWTNGYRQWVRFMAPVVTRLGLLLVAPSYRLAPAHPLPAAIDDAHTLLQTLCQRLPEWGGAANQLYLSGHSAGGHIATMAAIGCARNGLPGGTVRACLPISGIMDLHASHPMPGSLEERVYTDVLCGIDASQDVVLSPLYWTASLRLPVDLTIGEHDSARVRHSNQRMLALLQAQGVSTSLQDLPGRDHFDTHLDLRSPDHPWYQRLMQRVSCTPSRSSNHARSH